MDSYLLNCVIGPNQTPLSAFRRHGGQRWHGDTTFGLFRVRAAWPHWWRPSLIPQREIGTLTASDRAALRSLGARYRPTEKRSTRERVELLSSIQLAWYLFRKLPICHRFWKDPVVIRVRLSLNLCCYAARPRVATSNAISDYRPGPSNFRASVALAPAVCRSECATSSLDETPTACAGARHAADLPEGLGAVLSGTGQRTHAVHCHRIR